jgi:hypothetical protein
MLTKDIVLKCFVRDGLAAYHWNITFLYLSTDSATCVNYIDDRFSLVGSDPAYEARGPGFESR